MLRFKELGMQYGSRELFSDVDLLLQSEGRRYGLVGANGSGKSTFLRLIAGEEQPTKGCIEIFNKSSVGFLKQDQFRYENTRIVDVVIQGKRALWNAMQEKEHLFAKAELTEADGYRFGELEEIIIHHDGYTAEAFARRLLTGLGIPPDYHDKELHELSGGLKLRVLLAQVLFQQPDILLLDEPTNHLDIISINWLKNYLHEEFRGLLLFISHDRDFLNSVATHMLDVDYGCVEQYVGNYDQFLAEKAQKWEQRLKEQENSERKIEALQTNVDRFRAGTRARQAQSKQKQIDKMAADLPETLVTSRIAPVFRFHPKRPSGKWALTLKHLSKKFGERTVLNDISLQIKRGEKVAIIGSNGIGKSTLLKIALGKLPADSGECAWGHEVAPAYFAQDHHELLKDNMTALAWLGQQSKQETMANLRRALGQMLFSGSDVEKNILNLSGGEAARLLLANVMLQQPNVLVLDEVTNHLDLETVDALGKALKTYTGTVILVSHDHYFVSQVATRIVALKPKGITDFVGNYDEYLARYGEDFLRPYATL